MRTVAESLVSVSSYDEPWGGLLLPWIPDARSNSRDIPPPCPNQCQVRRRRMRGWHCIGGRGRINQKEIREMVEVGGEMLTRREAQRAVELTEKTNVLPFAPRYQVGPCGTDSFHPPSLSLSRHHPPPLAPHLPRDVVRSTLPNRTPPVIFPTTFLTPATFSFSTRSNGSKDARPTKFGSCCYPSRQFAECTWFLLLILSTHPVWRAHTHMDGRNSTVQRSRHSSGFHRLWRERRKRRRELTRSTFEFLCTGLRRPPQHIHPSRCIHQWTGQLYHQPVPR